MMIVLEEETAMRVWLYRSRLGQEENHASVGSKSWYSFEVVGGDGFLLLYTL